MVVVLFLHGLESSAQGAKARALKKAGFTVRAVTMPCRWYHLAQDRVALGLLCVSLTAGLVVGGAAGVAAALALVVGAGWLARRWLVRRVVERSVRVQVEELRRARPDVVLGSSFGGAVALQLAARGHWDGPLVLLAPAHELVARHSGRVWDAPALRGPLLVVHGTRDTVVPLEHSRRLVAATPGAQLLEVDDIHRLSRVANANNMREWVQRVVRPA